MPRITQLRHLEMKIKDKSIKLYMKTYDKEKHNNKFIIICVKQFWMNEKEAPDLNLIKTHYERILKWWTVLKQNYKIGRCILCFS